MQTEPLANQSQFHFIISGFPEHSFAVQQFSGTMAISRHYNYQIHCISQQEIDPLELMSQRAKLIITGDNYIHGLVTACHFLGMSSDGQHYSYQFFLSSNLESLLQRQSSQIFLNKSIPEIVKEMLIAANWSPTSFLFKLHQAYSAQKFIMQLNETDLSFIERLLSQAGLFYLFSQNSAEAQLWILDNPDDLPEFSNQQLAFFTESGAVKNSDSIYYLSEELRSLPQQVKLKNRDYQNPECDLTATTQNQTAIPGAGNIYQYGNGFETLAEGQRLAVLTQQAFDSQRQIFLIKTDCRGLQLGHVFTLTQHPQTDYNVAYRVISIHMIGNQLAQWSVENTARTYEACCTLTKTTAPLRVFPQAANSFPHALPAMIETINKDSSYPFLDDQGNYHVRFPFDQSDSAAGQASAAIPFLQHHGGALSGEQLATGLHFPLRTATQVAVGFIQGNLNLPVILGAIHNSENPSTVSSENNTQNTIRTYGANEFTLEDQATAPYAKLATKDHKNNLLLDATPDQHQISLTSAEGSIKTYAKKTVQIETGDSFNQTTSGNHTVNVQNKHSLMTKNENISYQSGNNLAVNANRHLQMAAENTVQIQSGQNTQIAANNNLSTHIKNGDLQIQAAQGKILIQSNKHVLVHSNGSNLTIGQPAGGIVASPEGNLYLSGPNIHFEAEEINIYGTSVTNTQPSSYKYQPPEKINDQDDPNKHDKTDDEEFKLFVATVYGEAGGSSETAWKAVGSVIINRVHGKDWPKFNKNVTDIIENTRFDAYDKYAKQKNSPDKNRKETQFEIAYNYLHDQTNKPPYKLLHLREAVKPVYYQKSVITNANYYYSPKEQEREGNQPPSWASEPDYNEVEVVGLSPSDDFEFYKH